MSARLAAPLHRPPDGPPPPAGEEPQATTPRLAAGAKATGLNAKAARLWSQLGPRFLPFADAATPELPFGRLVRLSLFQVSVGMAVVLLNGTLNRVMIVELGVPTWLVALMISLPLLFAPFRALVGFRSDHHRSVLGWKRVPYIWFGSLIQFGGLSIMPFALILLSGDSNAPPIVGQLAAALAFLLVGIGLHTTQTAGLALATDLAPEAVRPRVVAFLYVMLLVGMIGSSLAFGALLSDFDQLRLIKVIQGAAVLTMVVNVLALWKQEARDPGRTRIDAPRPSFRDSWEALRREGRWSRTLVAVGLGTAGFAMQDVLLEPYGAEVLKLTVGETTALTALIAAGTIAGFAIAAQRLADGGDPYRLAAYGAVVGLLAFSCVIFSAPLASAALFRVGTALIGFGGGLFAVGTLTGAMALGQGQGGLALGAWGAVQASAAGLAIAGGGILRDVMSGLAAHGSLGPALTGPSTGYGIVYHVELVIMLMTLVALGPLVRPFGPTERKPAKFGLVDLPG